MREPRRLTFVFIVGVLVVFGVFFHGGGRWHMHSAVGVGDIFFYSTRTQGGFAHYMNPEKYNVEIGDFAVLNRQNRPEWLQVNFLAQDGRSKPGVCTSE